MGNKGLQLIIALIVALIVLAVLIFIMISLDNKADLRSCEKVKNEELRYIPARCLNYYLHLETPDPSPSSASS